MQEVSCSIPLGSTIFQALTRLEYSSKRPTGSRGWLLPEISLQVLKALRAQGRLTIAQLASATGANRNTLKVRLRELVAEGRIRQHGKARATWYSLK